MLAEGEGLAPIPESALWVPGIGTRSIRVRARLLRACAKSAFPKHSLYIPRHQHAKINNYIA